MKKPRLRTGLLAVLMILLLLSLSNFAVGKYKDTFTGSGNVTFSANLAETMSITPPGEIRLIPGYDMTMTYTVNITKKSDVPAKLTISVTETPGFNKNYLTYALSADWIPDTENPGTYVYKETVIGTAAGADKTYSIPISLTVSQYIRSHELTAENILSKLTITARLDEVTN